MDTGVAVGPLPEDIEKVPEGFDFVELAIGEHEIPVEELDEEKLREDLEEKDFDLVVHLPFRQPIATSVEEFNEATLKYFDRLLEKSAELGAEKAVIHANMRDKDSETELGKLRNQIEELLEIGEEHDVEPVFENVRHVDTPTMWDLGRILEELDASMCFDIGHAAIEAEEEIPGFLEEYSHLVSHLHIHDIRHRGDSHISVGEGDIDFDAVTEKLQDFEGTASLEIFSRDMDFIALSRDKFLHLL